MKKLICAILAVTVIAVCALSGCGAFGVARDGIDGQDLNIYDIFDAVNAARAKEGEEQLSFLDFIKEYLNYEFEYKEDDLQYQMNRSLLSSVIIFPGFQYRNKKELQYGGGSGVIVDLNKSTGDAYIVTNAHVVYDSSASPKTAMDYIVLLYGYEDYFSDSLEHVELVGYSISYDLALLKVTNSDILKNSDACAAEFAQSEDVHVGEKVYTIGNPGGMGMSVTSGIISKESELIAVDFAEGTAAENVYRVIRTDAATNSGNSGGALYNSSGRIVGIVNAKDGDESNENMGYALCGAYVKRIWKLMRDGYIPSNGAGIRCSVFPLKYEYSSKSYFNSTTNLTEIKDVVKLINGNGTLLANDIIKHIKIEDGSGKAVEDVEVTRYYNIDDVLISARDGYKIIYTVERGGERKEITCNPTFINVV